MKTPLHLICRMSLLALSGALLSQCAHEPVTQANAANASASKISADSKAALQDLYAQNAAARRLGRSASGILVFPHIMKGGFVFGAEGGNGALLGGDGSVRGYYQTAAASYGLQAGVQKFGYALFGRMVGRLQPGFRRRGSRQVRRAYDQDHRPRHLRLHLRSERPHGRHRPEGLEDHQDQAGVLSHTWKKGRAPACPPSRRNPHSAPPQRFFNFVTRPEAFQSCT
jgi:hypothetical protein